MKSRYGPVLETVAQRSLEPRHAVHHHQQQMPEMTKVRGRGRIMMRVTGRVESSTSRTVPGDDWGHSMIGDIRGSSGVGLMSVLHGGRVGGSTCRTLLGGRRGHT